MHHRRILITGGAGFIGTRLAQALCGSYRVWILDNFHPQIHGANPSPPKSLQDVDVIVGDVRDPALLSKVLGDVQPNVIYHLAAETGTGQSQDEIARYCDVNVVGTARLLEAMRGTSSIEQFVLASSRAVYGEGLYHDRRGHRVLVKPRSPSSMKSGDFSVKDETGALLTPAATDEQTAPNPCSVYASTKLMQEYLVTQAGGGRWRAAILRLQNVYGPGQALTNPYTGVLSIFCAQLLSGKTLDIYEDGGIVRDFVFVDDVVSAFISVLQCSLPHGTTINVGSGRPTTILEAARRLIAVLNAKPTSCTISGHFRSGDVRYALADISRAENMLHWQPTIDVAHGLAELAKWAKATYREVLA